MRILGIDFGGWSIKAVEMESRFRRYEILDVHEIRLPLQILNPLESYKEAFQQLTARLPSHPEKISTSLSPAQTILRFLPLPIKQTKKVEKMFRFELEDNMPFRWDDAIVEHHVHRTPDGSLVVAGLALRRHIQSHLDWLKAVGADPDWLTFDGMGLVNLYLANSALRQAGPTSQTMLLDLGHHKTNIAVFESDRLQHFRTVSWGGHSINQAIALNLGISLEDAEAQKADALKLDLDPAGASEESKELLAAGIQGLQPLITDLNQNLVAYRNLYQRPVDNICLAGGTSRLAGIADFLESRLQIPVTSFDPMQGYKVKQEHSENDLQRFGESLGRALVFNRKSTLLFNFRQQEMGKGTSLNEIGLFLKNPAVLKLIRFVCIFAAILFLHVEVSSRLARNAAKNDVEELRKEFTKTFPSVPAKLRTTLIASPTSLTKFIQQKNSELEQRLKVLSKTRVTMLGMLKAVTNAFPETVKVDVNTLSFDDRKFLMEGVLYSGDLTPVLEALKKVNFLSQVQFNLEGRRFVFQADVLGR